MVVILCVEVFETHGPFDKGRSGEAAEDQRYRFVPSKVRKVHGTFAAHVAQLKVGGDVPGFGCQGIEPLLPRPGFLPRG